MLPARERARAISCLSNAFFGHGGGKTLVKPLLLLLLLLLLLMISSFKFFMSFRATQKIPTEISEMNESFSKTSRNCPTNSVSPTKVNLA